MATTNDRDERDDLPNRTTGDDRRPNPQHAATDPRGAAIQEQVKADHDALEESSRRVESSVSSDVRNTPIQHTDLRETRDDARDLRVRDVGEAAVDPRAAAVQDRVKDDHDALEESARRVKASVPADVRNTPVQPADDVARENADTLRDSARQVEDSERDRNRR